MAGLYGSNGTAAARHTAAAASLKAGILDLFWDSQKVDITNDLFIAQNIKLFQSSPSMISFSISIVGAMSSVPLHSIHSGVVSFPTKSQKTRSRPSRPSPLTWFSIAIMAPSPQHLLTQVSNGTHLHSLLRCYSTNKDFRDAPNVWPPHQYIVLQALKSLPTNVSKGTLPAPSSNQSTFDLIPSGQLGIAEFKADQIPLRLAHPLILTQLMGW